MLIIFTILVRQENSSRETLWGETKIYINKYKNHFRVAEEHESRIRAAE